MARLRRCNEAGLAVATASLALATIACAAWSRLLPQVTPTPTPEILADCFWSAQAFAWIDADGDGARDEGEQPLAGVEVNFSLTFLSGEVTGADGLAHVTGMHPGSCLSNVTINVVATPPQGYAPTTETAVVYTQDVDRYEFGFVPTAE
jgi:hypothetical protein